jgi:Membrane protein involved in the export of O-antigen and teichoic acid
MFRKVLETIGTRYIVALLNLALIFINARVLGVQGVGQVGLILAAVTMIISINSVLCGNTIVYFMSKYPVRLVLLPAYLWTPISSAVGCLLLFALGLLPEGYSFDVFWLSVLNSYVSANSRFLLGKDQVKGFNLTFLIQGGLLFFLLLYFYYICKEQTIQAYLWGMYLANGLALFVSALLLIPHLKRPEEKSAEKPFIPLVREMFAYGLWSSADSLAEVYTTRLNYFLVRSFSGLGAVGLLDAGTKISESVWHISRSVSFITYSEVSRQQEESARKQITLRLFKFTLLAVSFITLAIIFIPEWIYTDYLFTSEFAGMRLVILLLAPGILAFACNNVLGHYFIGSGRIRYSAFCSFTGLAVLIFIGYFLIPAYGIIGSAITSSIAFLSMLAFSTILFSRITSTRFREFLPGKQDFRFLAERVSKRDSHRVQKK